jgi:lipoprotein-releasing system ATP-binding protein
MLDARGVSRVYDGPSGPVPVLEGVDLALARGESACIVGPSGSGKSTLLYVLGTLERPTAGTVRIDGTDPFALEDDALARFRNRAIGFVFQDHCLLPQCTVLENVLVPTLVAPAGDHEARARGLLDRVGLGHRLDHRPGELSGGEKQRVAVARALVLQPGLLLCDEPTGNLDRRSADAVGGLILELQAALSLVLVVVTHSAELAARFDRRLQIDDGRLRPA